MRDGVSTAVPPQGARGPSGGSAAHAVASAGANFYRGRFAPSPTGPLHAGSLVAALASWLDARAHQGQWLVRMEDVDVPRTVAGAAQYILQQLSNCGLTSDEAVVLQSARSALYQQALDTLITAQWAYPCCCSRKDIAAAVLAQGSSRQRHGELVYPGTCRLGMRPAAGRAPPAWRFITDSFKQKEPIAPVKYKDLATISIAKTQFRSGTRWCQ